MGDFNSVVDYKKDTVVKQDSQYFMCSPFEFNSESSTNPLSLLFYYSLLYTTSLRITIHTFITYNYYISIISFESIES
ncbi:hypothetical protein MG7_01108 [Candida albicans P34048]|nr:hypothetical protein MEK_01139 [Candida albicans 12C]KGU31545.1 hypothetical protein MG7_01108 [Candida albicans P34048]